MDWMIWGGIGLACVVVGLVAGFIFGSYATSGLLRQELHEMKSRLSADHKSYFAVLRREIANLLIKMDPWEYSNLYRNIHWELQELEKADSNRRKAELKIISDRYPSIGDFDQFQTRDYVLVEDHSFSFDELAKVYRDLHVYCSIVDSVWIGKWRPSTSEKEREHLKSYIEQLLDTRLHHKIAQSYRVTKDFEMFVDRLREVDGFSDAWSKAIEEVYGRGVVKYETREFVAVNVYQMPEHGIGFQFQGDDTCGLVMLFSGDDRLFASIYRSDPRFEKREHLKALTVEQISVPFEYDDLTALGYKRR